MTIVPRRFGRDRNPQAVGINPDIDFEAILNFVLTTLSELLLQNQSSARGAKKSIDFFGFIVFFFRI